MEWNGPNHPFVVWASCFLWAISVFSIIWSLLLFLCVSDMLFFTGTDLVNALILLSGILMMPTTLFIMNSIATGKKINHKDKVLCCPLWLCIVCIIFINVIGVLFCIHKIYVCQETTMKFITSCMKSYKTVPKYKNFVDNLQWTFKCCGLVSYKDWYKQDWHDKVGEYELEPSNAKQTKAKNVNEVDSVPLSCCKSGSCVSSYLKELGTHSINTSGCGQILYRIIMISMNAHLVMFVSVTLLEVFILRTIIIEGRKNLLDSTRNYKNVSHIMSVNENFDASSGSYQYIVQDSDDAVEYEKSLNQNDY
ncbi:photoreceptor outer segment membrane glycoprotein 2-like [Zerene cesonia]|uniref:photoreceptor outer segment membrane glycoprotein 2-like n=1 Tax=Zerene cesonia TaxID=33412 RepID=UPI0018E58F20|nr:photoreceptor outer segment membrane glycoprotein 2-like [Zerene cesonia]